MRYQKLQVESAYLTIIPGARIEAEGRIGYDSEAMRARRITVLVKSN